MYSMDYMTNLLIKQAKVKTSSTVLVFSIRHVTGLHWKRMVAFIFVTWINHHWPAGGMPAKVEAFFLTLKSLILSFFDDILSCLSWFSMIKKKKKTWKSCNGFQLGLPIHSNPPVCFQNCFFGGLLVVPTLKIWKSSSSDLPFLFLLPPSL